MPPGFSFFDARPDDGQNTRSKKVKKLILPEWNFGFYPASFKCVWGEVVEISRHIFTERKTSTLDFPEELNSSLDDWSFEAVKEKSGIWAAHLGNA